MGKQKYVWEKIDLPQLGNEGSKQVTKESSQHEKHWEPVRKFTEPFLIVWRIKQFNLVELPKEEIGEFYNGDSYIVCKGSKDEGCNKLKYNVHFWIGKYSTQDEYATAAYKTVELDTYLDDAAIQHREVEGNESELFISYFDNLVICKGGFESGFRHVKPEVYKHRLLQFRKDGKTTYMKEVSCSKASVKSDDVFILDLGCKAYQFNGKACSAFEKSKAAVYLQTLENQRNGRCSTEVLEESTIDKDHEFWTSLSDKPKKPIAHKTDVNKALYRVSDVSGKMEITVITEDKASKSNVNEDDVFIIQTKEGLFVYIGKNCSVNEKKNALSNAHKHLQKSVNPLMSITVVTHENAEKFLAGIWD